MISPLDSATQTVVDHLQLQPSHHQGCLVSDYPDMDQATQSIQRVADEPDLHCSAQELGRSCWVDLHGLLVTTSQTDTRIGFGVRESLRLSPRLVRAIAEVNQSDPLGHLWLTEGADGGDWCLIWGATLPHRWTHVVDLQRAVFSCLTDQRAYLADLVTHFARFGGVASWLSPEGDQAKKASRNLIESLI